jgi:hypothetical protein
MPLRRFNICLLQSIINVPHILMSARNVSLLQLSVIMSMEEAAQGHTTIEEEEEAVMMNMQSGGSGPSLGSYESPENEFTHLLSKKRVQKGLDDLDPDYIPKQQEVW